MTHAPERARERAERNRRGGQAKATPKPSADTEAPQIANAQDALRVINLTIGDIWAMDNTAPRARALLAAAAQAINCLQIGALEERIRVLEEAKAND